MVRIIPYRDNSEDILNPRYAVFRTGSPTQAPKPAPAVFSSKSNNDESRDGIQACVTSRNRLNKKAAPTATPQPQRPPLLAILPSNPMSMKPNGTNPIVDSHNKWNWILTLD